MFRTIVIVAAIAVCAFMAGWFTIDRNEKETTIRFNRDEIRADTSKALAKGKEFLENNRQLDSEESANEESDWSFPSQTVDTQATYAPQPAAGQPAAQQATRPIPPWQQPQSAGSPNQY